ncbi:MAG: tetratricopeptide repeat protein [Anaerolineae bacterium]|nr:tetratricopeptide repeat protein [Anaerolineae bacterium]
MYSDSLIVRTKLAPPRLPKRTLCRPRVTQRLLEARDYRLTIVQAGAGYGKSTALSALAGEDCPLAWYHLASEDVDPLVFFLHLFYSFRAALPNLSEAPLAILEGLRGSSDVPWPTVVDLLVNELAQRSDASICLVVDDVHLLSEAPGPLTILDRLIGRAPQNLHIVLSTRYPLDLPTLVNWRVRGEVLEIDQGELAFTPPEIAALFRDQYRIFLTEDEVEQLAVETEGWAIALQLVWQGLRGGAVSILPQTDGRPSGPAHDFFTYLAQEVFEQQPPDVQEFLLVTAVLRDMTASICDCLRGAGDSVQILRYLLESGLFVVDLGDDHLRYHHLFRDVLRHRLAPPALRAAHHRAAICCRQHDQQEEAIYHFLAAEAFAEAATVLDDLGYEIVRAGRLDTLARWIGAFPPEVLEAHPALLVYLGDIARLHSRFDEALGWYRQAEERCRTRGDAPGVGQALRGQARVYLDTVNPSQAESLLQEALRLSDGQDDRETRARLLELLAENQLNRGQPEEAERFRAQARELREEGPGEAELAVRVLLRTGQLEQARRLLEEQSEIERREPVMRPRAHRETRLLLSLILALQGEGEAAYRCAVEGSTRGQALNSPFVIAVGYMRQGHAWLLRQEPHGYEQACRCFQEAIALSDSLAVPRLKVEACWGLCRAHGFQGAVDAAEQAAAQGLDIALRAGDEWIAALIRVSMGAGYILAHRYNAAVEWLTQAATAFEECSDTFGQAIVRLWQCLLWHKTGDAARFARGVEDLLDLVREHNHDYLFQRQTLLGPPDPRLTLPLLLSARDLGIHPLYAEGLLAQMGLKGLEFHPGYQLRVQALGPFRVWRGATDIPPQGWQREKARQLFQLFLTYRDGMLDREQIIEMLWPGIDPEAGRRNFKAAFSALCGVLEPDRKRGAVSSYVRRDGSLYGLRPGADVYLDAEQFEQAVAEGDRLFDRTPQAALAHYRQALAQYQGEYLQECPYEDWCSEERERLLTLYLRTADRVARTLIEGGEWEAGIEVCRSLLARDDCWERAYRLMMVAYARMGNRAQALRTYQRCVSRLREELEVEPSAVTVQLHAAIVHSNTTDLRTE